MNILHVVPYYAPAWSYGGVVRAVHGLATAQAALGHTVQVITTDALAPGQRLAVRREMIDGVTVHRCHNWIGALRRVNLSSPLGMRSTLHKLAPFQPDVIHCHELRTVENLFIPHQMAPLVVSPHGTLPTDTGRAAVKRNWDRLFGNTLARRFSGVVALTEAEADTARDWWQQRGVVVPPIAVIPNGVELPSRPALPVPHDQLTVLFMGRLHARKGVQLLIPAFARANVPNAQLLIAGPDEGMLAQLQQIAIEMGIAERVTFTGLLTGSARDEAFARADVFVLPAVGEGLPMVALEAMAAGLPVILTPGCHLPEAETRGAGVIVPREIEPLAEAIRALLSDSARRAAMGAAGQTWMRESFSWPAVAARMVDFYGTL